MFIEISQNSQSPDNCLEVCFPCRSWLWKWKEPRSFGTWPVCTCCNRWWSGWIKWRWILIRCVNHAFLHRFRMPQILAYEYHSEWWIMSAMQIRIMQLFRNLVFFVSDNVSSKHKKMCHVLSRSWCLWQVLAFFTLISPQRLRLSSCEWRRGYAEQSKEILVAAQKNAMRFHPIETNIIWDWSLLVLCRVHCLILRCTADTHLMLIVTHVDLYQRIDKVIPFWTVTFHCRAVKERKWNSYKSAEEDEEEEGDLAKPLPRFQFPTQLLADYSNMITPVRTLTHAQPRILHQVIVHLSSLVINQGFPLCFKEMQLWSLQRRSRMRNDYLMRTVKFSQCLMLHIFDNYRCKQKCGNKAWNL